jgi:hypothetical protein
MTAGLPTVCPSGAQTGAAAWGSSPLWRTALLALAITLCQTTLAVALSGRADLAEALATLAQFDGEWYGCIIDTGYACQLERLTEKGYQFNICFFPGFPLLAGGLQMATGLPTPVVLPLTGQFACWGFWIYFLLLLRRWGAAPGLTALGVLAVLLYPSAFFLVAGYSESLFLAALLGMIYWSRQRGPAAWALAALHGMLMCATRFVGVAVVVYPLLQAWLERPRREAGWGAWLRTSWPRLALPAAASLGALAYFAFCHFRFGHWDLYMYGSKLGWDVSADYLGALNPLAYRPSPPVKPDGSFCPDRLNTWFAPLLLVLAGGLLLAEYRWRTLLGRGWRVRASLYAGAGLLFYLTAAAKVSTHMGSMSRLALPVYVLLVLAAVHLLRGAPISCWGRTARALVLLGVASLALQLFLTYRFTHALWVA